LGRFLSFGAVGVTGVVIDLTVLTLLLDTGVDLLLANAAGWMVAVTMNFGGNYVVTYDRPAGPVHRLYGRYVATRGVTFGLLTLMVLVLGAVCSVSGMIASVAGLTASVWAGFALAETAVFGGGGGGE
jgi:dolichol-phosphate mannosyltransferase